MKRFTLLLALFSFSLLAAENAKPSGKIISDSVREGTGPKIDVDKDLLEQANSPEKSFFAELPRKVKACSKRHGAEAKQPEGSPDAEKLEKCVLSTIRSSYLPVIKKSFPDYESQCRVDCSPAAADAQAPGH